MIMMKQNPLKTFLYYLNTNLSQTGKKTLLLKNILFLKQYSPTGLTCAWIQVQINYYILIHHRWQTHNFDMASTQQSQTKKSLFPPCLTSSFKTSFKFSFPGRDDLRWNTVQGSVIDTRTTHWYGSFCPVQPSQSNTATGRGMASARYEWPQTSVNTLTFRVQEWHDYPSLHSQKYLAPSHIVVTKSVRLNHWRLSVTILTVPDVFNWL